MKGLFSKLPMIVIMMAVFAVLMLIPATYGAVTQDYFSARVFFYSGLLLGFLTLFLTLTMAGRPDTGFSRRHLLALLGVFILLPAILAVPVYEAIGNTSFLNAYVEMVSSLTTTGATLFDDPERLPESVHLWRALVGWMGGLIMWIGAIAILAPMALGGFEVRAAHPGLMGGARVNARVTQITGIADFSDRLQTYTLRLAPIYIGLSVVLWIGLISAGDTAFVAFCHALSTISTSGISPVGGLSGSTSGITGEVLIALFFIFAISRLTFSPEGRLGETRSLVKDPEIRIATVLILSVSVFLFIRHWIAAYEVEGVYNLTAGLNALWGTAFTALSFMTTSGFVSKAWTGAQGWSALNTPGLILMGLALVGGGVATTAGGVKLLRVYALSKHAMREMEKLVHPSSIGGSGTEARHMRSRGAYLAWVFSMLMVMSVALFMVAFSLTGEGLENAMVLTISALTTTGPLANLATAEPISYGSLSSNAKLILSAAMVMGRLETLAIIALLTPDLWRR